MEPLLSKAASASFRSSSIPTAGVLQDRIAETIVVTKRSYQSMQHTFLQPLLPDDGQNPSERDRDEQQMPDSHTGEEAL